MSVRSPLDPEELQLVAERQLADYRRGRPGTVFSQDVDLSLDDAYAVQRLVARLRAKDGETPVGFKLGCTGDNVEELFGMRGPVSGYLWRDEMHASGSWVSASRFTNLSVEAEVAVKLDENRAIAHVFPVIELQDFVVRGARPTLAELVANNVIHAGVVLAATAAEAPDALPGDATLELEIDGEVVATGSPFPMPGGAEASLAWLRPHLDRLGIDLRPGSMVLLGTPLPLVPVQPGAQVAARVAGMEARASITG